MSRHRLASLLGISLLLAAASPVAALEARSPGPGWEEANRNKELVIFTKDNKEAGVREIRAYTEVDAPPAVVFGVVGDFEGYPEFMPYVKESKILEGSTNSELFVYTLLIPPLVSRRDYVIQVKRFPGTAANGGVFRSEWTGVPGRAPEREGVVRVSLNTGSWTLEPLDGGRRTRLTYALLTNPGGSIPAWIANQSNTIAIPDLFKAVKKRSGEVNARTPAAARPVAGAE